jgi:predicted amidohydrolase
LKQADALVVGVVSIKWYGNLNSVIRDTKRPRAFQMAGTLKKINALILRNDSCVLATTDGETPHCSLMAHVPDDSGERLYLFTSSASRKYQKLRCRPRVRLLIDTRDEQQRERTISLNLVRFQQICIQHIFEVSNIPGFSLHVEICEDLWPPIPPRTCGELADAGILANLSGCNITLGKTDYRRLLCA